MKFSITYSNNIPCRERRRTRPDDEADIREEYQLNSELEAFQVAVELVRPEEKIPGTIEKCKKLLDSIDCSDGSPFVISIKEMNKDIYNYL